MKIYTYLNYGGNCQAAFEFYAEQLGGKITMMSFHGEHGAGNPGLKGKVLHARIEIGGTILQGADVPADVFQPMRSAYLALMPDTIEDAERIYELLTDRGEVFMPMAETFFANRFAMFRDRFGTSWMLLHEKPMG
jgi:PhnB protein